MATHRTKTVPIPLFFLLALVLLWPAILAAQPVVVATAEGQIGETPTSGDKIQGPSIEGLTAKFLPFVVQELLHGRLTQPLVIGGGQDMDFVRDVIHGIPGSNPVATDNLSFNGVFPLAPRSAWSRNATDTDDLVATSFTADGGQPMTQTVTVRTFDASGTPVATVTLDDLPTFPDPVINDTGVAVDDQGRVTVAYTELPLGQAQVRAQRLDGLTGLPLGGTIPVTSNRGDPDIALLDPAGTRLVIPTSNNVDIRANIVDFTGGAPMVLPEFPISNTPGLANILPTVAANPNTGEFTVAWENITGVVGDPVNIRARRFDAGGNPVGGDFIVNTNTANAQGQPAVAYGSGGESAIVWAGDSVPLGDELEVFAQVYDANGTPIGGEIQVNTDTTDVQDRPTVRFLPDADDQGRPQVVVAWRDVEEADGSMPRGTGTSYRCFSIEGLQPAEIFADGFESGDTTSWSDTQP